MAKQLHTESGFARSKVRSSARVVGVGKGVLVAIELDNAQGRLPSHAAVYSLPAEVDFLDRSVDKGLGLQSQKAAQVLGQLKERPIQ